MSKKGIDSHESIVGNNSKKEHINHNKRKGGRLTKFCDVGRHSVDKLWHARTKSRPSCCKQCLSHLKSSPQSDDNSKRVHSPQNKKKVARIKPISDKKQKELAVYRKLRDQYMKSHPMCEVRSDVCTGKSIDLHHKKPRAFHLLDVDVYMATCRMCHMKIERDDAWARENGYKLNHL